MKNKILIFSVLASVIAVVIGVAFFNQEKSRDTSVVKIGVVLPLTGPAAQYGKYCQQGIALAITEANKVHAADGFQIQPIFEDSKADPKEAVTITKKLISVDHIPVILCLTTAVTSAIAPICERSQVVLITSTIAPKAADLGDYVFRNAANIVSDAEAMAEFAVSRMGLKKVAIIGLNVDAIRAVEEPLRSKIQSVGGELVAVEFGNKGDTDFRTQLTKIKSYNPQALYIFGYIEIAYMLKQAKEIGLDVQFLGDPSMESPKVIEIAGDAANGVIYTRAAFNLEDPRHEMKAFQNSYKDKYGQVPELFAAQMYDSTMILSSVIAKNGIKADDIRLGLLDVKDYSGVSGNTTFLPNGDVIKPVSFKTIQNGKFVPYKAMD